MYEFLARRIHDGYLTFEKLAPKLKVKVLEAYNRLYAEEVTE